ncbi:ion transporter [Streptomyces sp. HUAS TT3]|uniref:ion transporter n=1 Tax=unclassified Streptomyces TaxID=2593676 RepID=UPI0033FF317A
MTVIAPSAPPRIRLAVRCRAVVDSPAFGAGVLALILCNAVLLGAETYHGFADTHRELLAGAENLFLSLFAVELAVRAVACADRPKAFLRDPWNLFDLAVLLAAFLPLIRENTSVLRLLRLSRVLRTARFLPQLRVLLIAVGRAVPGTLSFLCVGALVVYLYAMVGWMCFAGTDPVHFGSVGRACLTLFLLTTMDGFADAVRAGLELSRLTLLYYASYVLLASFVLVNVLIGVVLGSLEEAREQERQARLELRRQSRPEPAGPTSAELRARLAEARRALDEVEAALARTPHPARSERSDRGDAPDVPDRSAGPGAAVPAGFRAVSGPPA